MKTNEQSDEYHRPPELTEEEDISQLVAFGDAAVLLLEESSFHGGMDQIEDKPPEYFQELVRRAAFAAAHKYEKRREPVPPLVISALRAGEPDSLACEQADGDLIGAQLDHPNRRPDVRVDDAVN